MRAHLVLSIAYHVSHLAAASQASTHDVVHSDKYTLHRILHGVPEGMSDITPMQAFPMESNLDVMGGRRHMTRDCSPLR